MPAPTAAIWATDHWLYESIYKPLASQVCFVDPNLITIACFALVAPLLWGLWAGWPLWVLLVIAFVRQSLDCMDGAVARECDRKSRTGAILDVLEDTLTVGLMGTFIVFIMWRKQQRIPLWATAATAAFMVFSFARFAGYTVETIQGHTFIQAPFERVIHDNSVASALLSIYVFWWIRHY